MRPQFPGLGMTLSIYHQLRVFHTALPNLAPQDEGYEDFRALFTNLLDSDSASPQFELTKRMQAVAGPVMSRLSDAASKLIQ